jgi:hypothetical protein
VIGDLLVLWEMARTEAREQDKDEETEMREIGVWVLSAAFLVVAALMLSRLWLIADSLQSIAEKL